MKFIISKHCYEQIKRRGISVTEINEILEKPEKVIKQDKDITVYQSLSFDKSYLCRIFVNISKQPNLVLTAYKTSKIDKYHEDKI